MKTWITQLIIVIGMSASTLGWAATTAPTATAPTKANTANTATKTNPAYTATELKFSNNAVNEPRSLTFQVVQNQFMLNKKTILKASAGRTFDHKAAVTIVMTDQGAKDLDALLRGNVGKELTLVWNNNVISKVNINGGLGKQYQIVGFTPLQQRQFLDLFR
jgi:preprotein translocase subunit SecD